MFQDTLFIRHSSGEFRPATKQSIMETAAKYMQPALLGCDPLLNPSITRDTLCRMYGSYEHEIFGMLLLDNRHRVIVVEELFRGTLDGASVHPREVVKAALAHNAAAVILFHNHPSGVTDPSQADELITRRLKDALALVEVRVLDHLIVGGNSSTSFAERGLI